MAFRSRSDYYAYVRVVAESAARAYAEASDHATGTDRAFETFRRGAKHAVEDGDDPTVRSVIRYSRADEHNLVLLPHPDGDDYTRACALIVEDARAELWARTKADGSPLIGG